MDDYNCEHEFCYDSLSKKKVRVGLISTPEFQLNFWNHKDNLTERINSGCSDHTSINAYAASKSEGITEYL